MADQEGGLPSGAQVNTHRERPDALRAGPFVCARADANDLTTGNSEPTPATLDTYASHAKFVISAHAEPSPRKGHAMSDSRVNRDRKAARIAKIQARKIALAVGK